MTYETPDFFSAYQEIINEALKDNIQTFSFQDVRLAKAIEYSTLLGGKRIRPILTLATAECVGTSYESSLPFACAVEFIHAYSLIHDDLPAMDDDDLRRGQATCHKAFDEATAILAGDALQAMAFELISQQNSLPPEKIISMIQTLSRAAGAKGMVYGQALDFGSVGKKLDLVTLEHMHRHKTGVLIEASVILGVLTSKTDILPAELTLFKGYAQAIGLAFQVQDDILDIVSDTQTLGKTQGADEALNKPTYPALLGLEGAKEKLTKLHEHALNSLQKLTRFDTQKLEQISHFIVQRIR